LWLLVGLATLGALVVVGIVPACRAMRAQAREPSRGNGWLGDNRQFRRWPRRPRPFAQPALAVILLVGAAFAAKLGRTW